MREENFHGQLRDFMDDYAHLVYCLTKKFPRDEIYGLTSQLRRSALSVVLNYIEGYARMKSKVYKNFLEISYGSLQESKYLLTFAFKEGYAQEDNFNKLTKLADNIGAMLWGIIRKM